MSWWKPILKWIGQQALAYAEGAVEAKIAEQVTKKPRKGKSYIQ